MTHVDKFGFSFDYPAAWNLVDLGTYKGGVESLDVSHAMGFVGTGSATQTCKPWARTSPAQCTTTWTLPTGSIEIRIGRPSWAGDSVSTVVWNEQTAIFGPDIAGAQRLTIDHLPARFVRSDSNVVPLSAETIPGATEVLWWGLPLALPSQQALAIVAAINGPDAATLEAEAKAMVESIVLDHRPTVLPTDPSNLAAARDAALRNFFSSYLFGADAEHNHSVDCFPRVVGASQNASIIQTLNASPMTQPLPVTCETVSMDPNPMQGWTVTLKQTWAPGSDYPAGIAGVTCTTAADGMVLGCSYVASKTINGPGTYPHVGPSRYKG